MQLLYHYSKAREGAHADEAAVHLHTGPYSGACTPHFSAITFQMSRILIVCLLGSYQCNATIAPFNIHIQSDSSEAQSRL